MRGCVDLDHVDGARPPGGQVAAGPAVAAGPRRGAALTVQRPGEDARRGRLATTARTGEQIGVVDPVVRKCALQRGGDVLLPDDLGECVGPVATVEREGLGRPGHRHGRTVHRGRSSGLRSSGRGEEPRTRPGCDVQRDVTVGVVRVDLLGLDVVEIGVSLPELELVVFVHGAHPMRWD
ncbi:hypothetical protein SDC9_154304 [bioreactor metagenome]|uniref:Uncharacterized protein n=1 Tax=bioreactor metagenome TaxID=1076179 RepID=A0A645EYC3_9ZZZZ